MPKSKLTKFAVALAVFAAAAIAGFGTGTANAGTGGVSIVNDGYSPYFTPSTIHPGDTTTLQITTEQDRTPKPEAYVRISNLFQAGITAFLGNGDTSATCVFSSNNGGQLRCHYTDYEHSYKSDVYTFATNPHQAYGTYAVDDYVNIVGGGNASATSYLTYKPVPVPKMPSHDSAMKVCYAANGVTPSQLGIEIVPTATEGMNDILGGGNWAPTAIGFFPDGKPILSCLPQDKDPGAFLGDKIATQYTDNNGDVFGIEQATWGNYPIELDPVAAATATE